jgi:hypothetical protein
MLYENKQLLYDAKYIYCILFAIRNKRSHPQRELLRLLCIGI